MTRINSGINPKSLSRQHLIAEHREIKRIPNVVAKLYSQDKLDLSNIPNSFRLGEGHVRFFYDKCGYLLKRYKQIYKECRLRKYNVTNFASAWENVPQNLMGDWQETEEAGNLIKARMEEKL